MEIGERCYFAINLYFIAVAACLYVCVNGDHKTFIPKKRTLRFERGSNMTLVYGIRSIGSDPLHDFVHNKWYSVCVSYCCIWQLQWLPASDHRCCHRYHYTTILLYHSIYSIFSCPEKRKRQVVWCVLCMHIYNKTSCYVFMWRIHNTRTHSVRILCMCG